MDTEIFYNWLFELVVLNGRGEIDLHIIPLNKDSWAEIQKTLNGYEQRTLGRRLARARFNNTMTILPMTGTLTAHEIVDVLERAGWSQRSNLAELSTGYCNYRNLERCFVAFMTLSCKSQDASSASRFGRIGCTAFGRSVYLYSILYYARTANRRTHHT